MQNDGLLSLRYVAGYLLGSVFCDRDRHPGRRGRRSTEHGRAPNIDCRPWLRSHVGAFRLLFEPTRSNDARVPAVLPFGTPSTSWRPCIICHSASLPAALQSRLMPGRFLTRGRKFL